MTPEARGKWSLSDPESLSNFSTSSNLVSEKAESGINDPLRLLRFVFAVVQTYLNSSSPCGKVIKHALAALQLSTMQQSAEHIKIARYSET